MTIVEVLLHKWRMLDNRRRRVILGAILIALSVALIVFFATSSNNHNSDQPVTPTPEPNSTTTTTTPSSTTTSTTTTTTQSPPQPDTTTTTTGKPEPQTTTTELPPQTTSTTTTTTQQPPQTTTTAPLPEPEPVLSDDGLALVMLNVSLLGNFNEEDEKEQHQLLVSLTSTKEGKLEFSKTDEEHLEFVLTESENRKILMKFTREEGNLGANLVKLEVSGDVNKTCDLDEGQNFFLTPVDKHYKCNKVQLYDCVQNDNNNNNNKVRKLAINYLEFELLRTADKEKLFQKLPHLCD